MDDFISLLSDLSDRLSSVSAKSSGVQHGPAGPDPFHRSRALEKRRKLITDSLVKVAYPVLRMGPFYAKPSALSCAAKLYPRV